MAGIASGEVVGICKPVERSAMLLEYDEVAGIDIGALWTSAIVGIILNDVGNPS